MTAAITKINDTLGAIVKKLDGSFIGIYTSIRKCSEFLHVDRHKIARVSKGELRKDYLGYIFEYGDGQTTIESIA